MEEWCSEPVGCFLQALYMTGLLGPIGFLQTGITLVLWDHLRRTDEETWRELGRDRKAWNGVFWVTLGASIILGAPLLVALVYLFGLARALRRRVPDSERVWRSSLVVGRAWFLAAFTLFAVPLFWLPEWHPSEHTSYLLTTWAGTAGYTGLVVMARTASGDNLQRLVLFLMAFVGFSWMKDAIEFCGAGPRLAHFGICRLNGLVTAFVILAAAGAVGVALQFAYMRLAGLRARRTLVRAG